MCSTKCPVYYKLPRNPTNWRVKQIFSRLEPADLLSLARTSKNFRKTLMSRKAASIWKAARRQMLGVPTCPSDVSEPRWANLLFGGSKCQVSPPSALLLRRHKIHNGVPQRYAEQAAFRESILPCVVAAAHAVSGKSSLASNYQHHTQFLPSLTALCTLSISKRSFLTSMSPF